MHVRLRSDLLPLFPRAAVAVVVCQGEQLGWPSDVAELVGSWERDVAERLFIGTAAEHPRAAAWQGAYRTSGTNP